VKDGKEVDNTDRKQERYIKTEEREREREREE
jgi:hypothetical protein